MTLSRSLALYATAAALLLVGACKKDEDDAKLRVTSDNLLGNTYVLEKVSTSGTDVPGVCPQEITFLTSTSMTVSEADLNTCRPFIAPLDDNGRQILDPLPIAIRNDSLIIFPDDDFGSSAVGLFRYEVTCLTETELVLDQVIATPVGSIASVSTFRRK